LDHAGTVRCQITIGRTWAGPGASVRAALAALVLPDVVVPEPVVVVVDDVAVLLPDVVTCDAVAV